MKAPDTDIVLLGINARYRHTAFGLRCLQANLGALEDKSVLVETTLTQRPIDIVEQVLPHNPRIVGLGVYVWNVTLCEQVAQLLKRIRPDICLVLGGPEISHETEGQLLWELADHIVCGEGEQVFSELCEQILADTPPQTKVLPGTNPPMDALASPYRLYTDKDIEQRVIYVEASRGCPYRCQFCLSALDKAVRTVEVEGFFADMKALLDRGATDFKFIDRTFNLRIDFSLRILDFFLENSRPGMTLHFEMVPDRLPEPLREKLAQFPPGVVQLEIGIQTFDPAVSRRIERPQNLPRITENLRFLRAHTEMYLHVDLIVGLPGESLESFAAGFDQLVALDPHEIQVGILKRLKGTPIVAHDAAFEMVYSPLPPFEVLSTSQLSFEKLQEMKRFARYWDMVANRGQFQHTAPLIWHNEPSPFSAFRSFSAWLFCRVQRTSQINLLRLAEHLFDFLVEQKGQDEAAVGRSLVADLYRVGGRSLPQKLQPFADRPPPPRHQMAAAEGLARQSRRS